jgi:cell division protease FtsH
VFILNKTKKAGSNNIFTLVLLILIAFAIHYQAYESDRIVDSSTYIDPSNISSLSSKEELQMIDIKNDNLIYFSQGKKYFSSLKTDEVLSNIEFSSSKTIGSNILLKIVYFIMVFFILQLVIKMLGFARPISIGGGAGGGVGGNLLNNMTSADKFKVVLPKKGLDSLAGILPETMEEVHTAIDLIKMNVGDNTDKKGFIKPINGILFYGPPGTGKTVLAKAMAKEIEADFYELSGSSLDEMLVGVGSARIRNLFAEARKNQDKKPQVIFIDEIDALAKKRTNGGNTTKEETLNELLVEMSKVQGMNIIMIFATNFYTNLDEAFLRPGRIDLKIEVSVPDIEGRKELIKLKATEKNLEHLLAYAEDISVKTFGFTGADIEDMFNKVQLLAFRAKRVAVIGDVEKAIERQQLGTKGRIQISGDRKARVAYHEAGHALIQLLNNPESVSLATIAPHSGSLGLVAMKRREDDMLMTRKELLNRITMSLGGAAGEMYQYGDDHSAGVSGDFDSAMRTADTMVNKLGMTVNGIHFPETEKEAKKEIKVILDYCLENAKKMIEENNDSFLTIVNLLIEKETVRGDELNQIVNA